MPIDVKICGLTEGGGVDAALAAGADMLGFVFFPPSPRHLEVDRATRLAEPARGRARIVALTVDADDATLAGIVSGLAPDILQLHGSETPARVAAITARFGLPVMKAIGVRVAGDVAPAARYAAHVERILFDAKPPAGATRPGGLGMSFDWNLVAGLDVAAPCMLSGGLDPDTVVAAITTARPGGVDVSSGVERAPGIKDPALVAHFVARVRALEAAMSLDKERMAT